MGYPFDSGCCCAPPEPVTRPFCVQVTGCSEDRSGDLVTFKVNGADVSTVATDASGVACATFTYTPGDSVTAGAGPTGFNPASISWDGSDTTWTAGNPGPLALSVAAGYTCTTPTGGCCDPSTGVKPYPTPTPDVAGAYTATFKGVTLTGTMAHSGDIINLLFEVPIEKPATWYDKDCSACDPLHRDGLMISTTTGGAGPPGDNYMPRVSIGIRCNVGGDPGTWEITYGSTRYAARTDCGNGDCDPHYDWFDGPGFDGNTCTNSGFTYVWPNQADCTRGHLLLSGSVGGDVTIPANTDCNGGPTPLTIPLPSGTFTFSIG